MANLGGGDQGSHSAAADLATLTERVRRGVVRWFRMQRFLDADTAADMLARENSGFSVDASVRITLIDRDVPCYFQSLEHLLRYCARPPFAPDWGELVQAHDDRPAEGLGRPSSHRLLDQQLLIVLTKALREGVFVTREDMRAQACTTPDELAMIVRVCSPWIKSSAAGCGGYEPRKTSAFFEVRLRGSGFTPLRG